MFIQQLLNGVSLGFTYVLIALGLTMVYGVLKMLHFAHGVIYTIGVFAAMEGVLHLHLSFALALVFAMVVSAIAGVLIERLAYRPLRDVHPITTLISGVGITIMMENILQLVYTSDSHAFPSAGVTVTPLHLGSITITNVKIWIIIAGIIAILLLYAFLRFTKLGIAIQAASQDTKAAALMGIHVNRVISITFFIGSAFAALAGVFVALSFNAIFPTMGSMPGLKAFCVVVLGGLGSIPGTIIGGLIIGIVETFSEGYLSGMVVDKDAIAFIILIIILLVKPSGLFGKNMEKV